MTITQTIQVLADRISGQFGDGMRVRIFCESDGKFTTVATGKAKVRGFSSERLLNTIRELEPDEAGVIDVWASGREFKVSVSGKLAGSTFQQRLRNVVINQC